MATFTQIAGTRSVTSSQVETEAAPDATNPPANAPSLVGLESISVYLVAPGAETINSLSGQVDIWIYDPDRRLAPSLVLLVPPGAAGQTKVLLASFKITRKAGIFVPLCNGIDMAGGTAVTLEILCKPDAVSYGAPNRNSGF